ncbi:MAG: DNA-3-methyladenine glycosylase family protein [Candidatus Brocadiales bacterium]
MSKSKLQRIKTKDFNLQHTLECGQFFRARLRNNWYYINSRDEFFKIRQKDDVLEYKGVDGQYIKNFFSLDEPLDEILYSITKDRHIERAVELYHGLRIIRHDPWECLVSYICSSASNIPRIRSCMERIAKRFGKKITLDGIKSNTFPGPNIGLELRVLEKIGLGFRARYVLEASQSINDLYLDSLRELSYDDAKQLLMENPGVGEKVADCVLLFSLGFTEAFPVDRWIKRTMQKIYFRGRPTSNRKIQEFAHEYFGQYAGYAQEYLYLYGRQKRW